MSFSARAIQMEMVIGRKPLYVRIHFVTRAIKLVARFQLLLCSGRNCRYICIFFCFSPKYELLPGACTNIVQIILIKLQLIIMQVLFSFRCRIRQLMDSWIDPGCSPTGRFNRPKYNSSVDEMGDSCIMMSASFAATATDSSS